MLKSGSSVVPLLIALVTSTVSIAGSSEARGDKNDRRSNCGAFVGPFTSVTGPPCTSPIGLCTHGMLSGEFPARYDFTFTTLDPAGDPSDPTKFVYTGTSVVTATDGSGVFFTIDTGVIHIPNDGTPAPFVTKAIVDRGTRHLKHTVGGFVATGSLVFATGEATGAYNAVLCTKHDD